MLWTGIPWKTLALIGGAAGLLISLLYILKTRERRVVIPYLPLWKELLRESPVHSFWKKFKRFLSWLFQLFILTLLLIALADPKFKSEILQARYFTIIIDLSASMKVRERGKNRQLSPDKALSSEKTDSEKIQRIHLALREAEKFIKTLYPNDRAALLAMSNRAEVIIPFTTNKSYLLKGLSKLKALDTSAAISSALELASDLLRDKNNKKIILITDGIFPKNKWNTSIKNLKEKVPISIIKVGSSKKNVGIVSFSARRLLENPSQFSVYIELINFSNEREEGFLELYSGGILHETIPIKLKGKGHWKKVLGPYEGRDQILEVRWFPLRRGDAFPVDDKAFAVLPSAPKINVAVVGEENLYLRAALLADGRIVSRYFKCGERFDFKRFDAVIYNSCNPAKDRYPRRWIIFGPKGELPLFKIAQNKKGKYKSIRDPIITEVNSRHPVMRYLQLEDLNISSSVKFAVQRDVKVLASSFGEPIFSAYSHKGTRAIAVGFSLGESDFVLRIAFPLFLNNALNWILNRKQNIEFTPGFRTGKAVELAISHHGGTIQIEGPKGIQMKLKTTGDRAIFIPQYIGIYRAIGPKKIRKIAVNLFDSQESQIDPKGGVELEGGKSSSHKGKKTLPLPYRRPLWWYLTMAVALLFLLEWWTYNRRITV